jgi:hypothetical protein
MKRSIAFPLAPVALASNLGFTTVELRRIQRLVVEHGRTISVPLVWFPRLLSATPEQRANWRVAGGGFGIHWPARLRVDRPDNRGLIGPRPLSLPPQPRVEQVAQTVT